MLSLNEYRKKVYYEQSQQEGLETSERIEALLDVLKIECIQELQECANTLNFNFTCLEFFNLIVQESKLHLYEQDIGLEDRIKDITDRLKRDIENEIMDLDPQAIDYDKISKKSPEWMQKAAERRKNYGDVGPLGTPRERKPFEEPSMHDPSASGQYAGMGVSPGTASFNVGAGIASPKRDSLWDKFKSGASEFLKDESTKQELKDLLVEAGMNFQSTLQRVKNIIDKFGRDAKAIIKSYDVKSKPEFTGVTSQDVGAFDDLGSTQDVMAGGMPEMPGGMPEEPEMAGGMPEPEGMPEEPEMAGGMEPEEYPDASEIQASVEEEEEEEERKRGRRKLTPAQVKEGIKSFAKKYQQIKADVTSSGDINSVEAKVDKDLSRAHNEVLRGVLRGGLRSKAGSLTKIGLVKALELHLKREIIRPKVKEFKKGLFQERGAKAQPEDAMPEFKKQYPDLSEDELYVLMKEKNPSPKNIADLRDKVPLYTNYLKKIEGKKKRKAASPKQQNTDSLDKLKDQIKNLSGDEWQDIEDEYADEMKKAAKAGLNGEEFIRGIPDLQGLLKKTKLPELPPEQKKELKSKFTPLGVSKPMPMKSKEEKPAEEEEFISSLTPEDKAELAAAAAAAGEEGEWEDYDEDPMAGLSEKDKKAWKQVQGEEDEPDDDYVDPDF